MTLSALPFTPSPPLAPEVERFGLSDPQRYGLLQIRGGRASAELRAIMDAMGWPKPSRSDWAELRERGLIARRRDDLLHDLLPKGLTAARAVIGDLCRKFNVHVIDHYDGARGVAPYAACSCERWRHTVPRNSSAGTRLGVAAGNHIELMRVDPGGTQRKARIEAIFARVGERLQEARNG